ncbi:Uncharacterised protein [Vibrio cholerae]|nr:Uncharacterised protein [Vibrio cholerae]CSC14331.1 Uncharacterised protein [Vibrio cholerae]CSD53553.1 Uncharacterised protein [Vibrio cholerae]
MRPRELSQDGFSRSTGWLTIITQSPQHGVFRSPSHKRPAVVSRIRMTLLNLINKRFGTGKIWRMCQIGNKQTLFNLFFKPNRSHGNEVGMKIHNSGLNKKGAQCNTASP